jgi:hypothetical protein
LADLVSGLQGRAFARGDVGYEIARTRAVWNGRKPARFPDVIIQAENTDDVSMALGFARENGMRVGVRSGGHSWSASFLREGGVLLDVSGLDHCEIYPDKRRAVVGPGLWGSRLNTELAGDDLFFPGGHCESVALGGYLLQGGYGLGGRHLGPSCANVTGIEVVTADGERLRLDPNENADLFWAARGSGAGFFAAITSFELAIAERPSALLFSRYEYSIADLDDLLRWAADLGKTMSPRAEFTLAVIGPPHEGGEPSLEVSAFTLAYSEEDAIEDLKFMSDCPIRSRALSASENQVSNFERQRCEEARLYPAGMRFAMDNAMTDADVEDLIPVIHEIVDTLPESPAHMLWLPWGKAPTPEDMAFSAEAEVFITACAMWTDPNDDDRYQSWVTGSMRNLEPLSSGTRLSDENLFDRPFRFMDDKKLDRVESLRRKYDPARLFHCVWLAD